jgi:hypothetical protein
VRLDTLVAPNPPVEADELVMPDTAVVATVDDAAKATRGRAAAVAAQVRNCIFEGCVRRWGCCCRVLAGDAHHLRVFI